MKGTALVFAIFALFSSAAGVQQHPARPPIGSNPAVELRGSPDREQQARAEKLEQSLLAPCCYTETVATHRSEVALAMKAEIAKLISDGKSDRQILDFYKERYGLRVLVEPEGARSWWVHLVPVAAILLGFALVILLLRRWLRPIPSS